MTATTNFLDDLPAIDWQEFDAVASTTKSIVRRLAADRSLLAALVDNVPNRPDLLRQCEHHRLLDRLVIYDGLDRGFKIRLHLSTDDHLDRPHDHRFSFTTLILRGQYDHIWYEPKEVAEGVPGPLRPLFATTERLGAVIRCITP